ncbi:MAG: radical SAM domain-containing protein [Candidatus Magnetoglobus multicellularis str. Araruama]|uniref:7-carboxy-7-deazaguanine synthase n=1 Tax=Candidatus Magnetoglobus multicellularis str. Araruama TaxID=890399 RepID=A0A1V1PDS6_9BACT|nr:MAG: radical SAM domain-containing protein [Candidatus Magnetoglobus multicellularis str. Araruama]
MSICDTYKINEIFKSRQGEGFNTGKEVMFIRLSGCRMSCSWCDTDHKKYEIMSVGQICNLLTSDDTSDNILITGGEPTDQSLLPLLKKIRQHANWIGLETNGTNNISQYKEFFDYITVSPKTKGDLHPSSVLNADEVRIVTGIEVNLNYIKRMDKLMLPSTHRFLSPLSFLSLNKTETNLPYTISLLSQINQQSKNPWHLSIQTHKLIGIK